MKLNRMIMTFLALCALSLLISGCSLADSVHLASLRFSVSRQMVAAVSQSRALSEAEQEGLMLEVTLYGKGVRALSGEASDAALSDNAGDFETSGKQTQTVPFVAGEQIIFEEVSAPSTVTLSAVLYQVSSEDETKILKLYDASKEVKVIPGDNEVSLTLGRSLAPYLVHHFLQSLDTTSYTEDTEALETLFGKNTHSTEASPKDFPGFTAVTPIGQKVIEADGTTEISIQYTRNSYTVSYDANGGTGDVTGESSYLFGETVFVDFGTLTRDGYEFAGWSDGENLYSEAGDSFVVGAGNVVLSAV